jgi:hypothetical protein
MRDFSALMDVAIELGNYNGYLDTQGLKERGQVLGRFNSLRNRFVYDELSTGEDPAAIKQSIASEVDDIMAHEPVWGDTLIFVRDEIFARIDHESRKSPLARTVYRWMPLGIGIACLIVYVSIRLLSGLDVSAPIATKLGIEERAAAYSKAMRYDEWLEGAHGRNGLVLGALLWPIEPSNEEVSAARDMVGLSLAGADFLAKHNEICPSWASDEDGLTQQRKKLVGDVVAYVDAPGVKWRKPPAMTLLDPIRTEFPCADEVSVTARPKTAGAR